MRNVPDGFKRVNMFSVDFTSPFMMDKTWEIMDKTWEIVFA
jgi:hypothetical protein